MLEINPAELAILISALECEIQRWTGFSQWSEESDEAQAEHHQGLQARTELLRKLQARQASK